VEALATRRGLSMFEVTVIVLLVFLNGLVIYAIVKLSAALTIIIHVLSKMLINQDKTKKWSDWNVIGADPQRRENKDDRTK
jgi:hypothetical protein